MLAGGIGGLMWILAGNGGLIRVPVGNGGNMASSRARLAENDSDVRG